MILYFLCSKFLKQHLVGNLTRHKGPLPEWACSSLPSELLKPVDPWFSTVPHRLFCYDLPIISIHIHSYPSYEAFQSHGVMGVPLVLIHFLFGFSWVFYETIQLLGYPLWWFPLSSSRRTSSASSDPWCSAPRLIQRDIHGITCYCNHIVHGKSKLIHCIYICAYVISSHYDL